MYKHGSDDTLVYILFQLTGGDIGIDWSLVLDMAELILLLCVVWTAALDAGVTTTTLTTHGGSPQATQVSLNWRKLNNITESSQNYWENETFLVTNCNRPPNRNTTPHFAHVKQYFINNCTILVIKYYKTTP